MVTSCFQYYYQYDLFYSKGNICLLLLNLNTLKETSTVTKTKYIENTKNADL